MQTENLKNKTTLSVGQTIYVLPSHHYRIREPKGAKISKVGKKYFELEGYSRSKFNIETLKEENDTNYESQCYLTLQEVFNEKEIERLEVKMRNFFGGYNRKGLLLEQLRKIENIISENK